MERDAVQSGERRILWNAGTLLPHYMRSHPRRQQSWFLFIADSSLHRHLCNIRNFTSGLLLPSYYYCCHVTFQFWTAVTLILLLFWIAVNRVVTWRHLDFGSLIHNVTWNFNSGLPSLSCCHVTFHCSIAVTPCIDTWHFTSGSLLRAYYYCCHVTFHRPFSAYYLVASTNYLLPGAQHTKGRTRGGSDEWSGGAATETVLAEIKLLPALESYDYDRVRGETGLDLTDKNLLNK